MVNVRKIITGVLTFVVGLLITTPAQTEDILIGNKGYIRLCQLEKVAACNTTPHKPHIPPNLTLLKQVNAQVNKLIAYMPDDDDEWNVLVNGGGGDCEDYALTKFEVLADAGWPRRFLKLVMGQLTIDGMPQYHTVLVATVHGREYVLDNAYPDVVTYTEYQKRFVPRYEQIPLTRLWKRVISSKYNHA